MPTEVKRCKCSGTPAANYQDKVYGNGMRVMNQNSKKNYRCTVCGTEIKG